MRFAAAAGKAQVFVSDTGLGDVFGFDPKGNVLTFLTGFAEPQGMTTDKAGNLYVTNTLASDILVFKPPYTTVSATLEDPGQYPVDVAVDPNTGVIAVTNIIDTSGGSGSVSFYKNLHAVGPSATVYNATWARVYFGAFDAYGDLFVDALDVNGVPQVGVVQGELHALTITQLALSNQLQFPGGVQVTSSGNIAVGDQNTNAIYTYAPPTSLNLGSPIATTSLLTSSDTVTFAFNTNSTMAWTADAEAKSLFRYAYPTGGNILYQHAGFLQPIGAAYAPPAIP